MSTNITPSKDEELNAAKFAPEDNTAVAIDSNSSKTAKKTKTTKDKKVKVEIEPNLKVLFCASEVSPFAASGGLADVAGSLPIALNEKGCDVRVILPLYEKVNQQWRDKMVFLSYFFVPLGWRSLYCGL